jgi:predicted transcriptional regulator
MTKKHVTLRMPDELVEKVEAEAKRQRRSRSFIIEEIISQHYSQNGNKPAKKKARTA